MPMIKKQLRRFWPKHSESLNAYTPSVLCYMTHGSNSAQDGKLDFIPPVIMKIGYLISPVAKPESSPHWIVISDVKSASPNAMH